MRIIYAIFTVSIFFLPQITYGLGTCSESTSGLEYFDSGLFLINNIALSIIFITGLYGVYLCFKKFSGDTILLYLLTLGGLVLGIERYLFEYINISFNGLHVGPYTPESYKILYLCIHTVSIVGYLRIIKFMSKKLVGRLKKISNVLNVDSMPFTYGLAGVIVYVFGIGLISSVTKVYSSLYGGAPKELSIQAYKDSIGVFVTQQHTYLGIPRCETVNTIKYID